MSIRLSAGLAGAAFLAFLLLTGLVSCQTEEPPPGDQILKLSLDDSLKRYDSVTIVVVDFTDTALVLENLWSGPLFDPSTVPPKTLTAAKDKPFKVKITGYSGDGQVAYKTWINYQAGAKTVVHEALPPVYPKKWITRLSPSVGTISPTLAQDVQVYSVLLPEGASSLTLDVQAAHDNDKLTVAGENVPRGSQPKSFTVQNGTDTVAIVVQSPLGMVRQFKVALVPHSPVPVALARIEVIAPARLDPEFDFETTEYGVDVYNGADSASFKFYPADPKTMSMTITDNGIDRIIAAETVYKTGIKPGETDHVFSIRAIRGGESKSYDLYINRK